MNRGAPAPANMQQHLNIIQKQINDLQHNLVECFNLVNKRTEDIIIREHKLQNDINDLKLFLKTRMGAPDASRLKEIMKVRLDNETTRY